MILKNSHQVVHLEVIAIFDQECDSDSRGKCPFELIIRAPVGDSVTLLEGY